MSTASEKSHVTAKFEEEYVRCIEARYSIKVSPKSDEKSTMGSSLIKSKSPMSGSLSVRSPSKYSPEKENGRLLRQLSPNDKQNKKSVESITINIKNRLQETKSSVSLPHEMQMTKGVSPKGSVSIHHKGHQTKSAGSIPQGKASRKSRKRKAEEIESGSEVLLQNKKRKISCMIKRLRISPDCCDHQNPSDSPLRGLRKTIAAKRANAILNGNRKERKEKLENDEASKLGNAKSLNLQELYKTKLKEAGSEMETSPFKGKMSAFEISLLKGKQSVERRKSLEASTLRSSPRMNPNVQQPNYSDVKRQRTTRSLTPSLSAVSRKQKLSADLDSQTKKPRPGKRRRKSSKGLHAVSPSSVENCYVAKSKRFYSQSRRRSSRSVNEMNNSVPEIQVNSSKASRNSTGSLDRRKAKSSAAFNYRMNGAPTLKGLPAVLSLNNLSGVPQKIQGSSFTSFHKRFCANGLSGMPPALSASPPELNAAGEPSAFFKPSPRPSSLPVEKNSDVFQVSCSAKCANKAPSPASEKDCEGVVSTVNKNMTELKERNKKLSLEETVNMLRRSSNLSVKSARSSSSKLSMPATTLSPSMSEGRLSRRSSRSSTPNISPIKSEILTPSCTPCSTPNKSPRASPSASSHSAKVQKNGKRKRYLFSKHDDVLARWHDGLFYLGKILRIDDKNKKCLLRYEDNSEYWSMFKDIHRVAKEEEMICCVCLGESSEPPDEIVLCDNCCQGYHQKCHTPDIGSGQIVDPDDEWYCRECVFLMSVKLGGAVKDGSSADELKQMKLTLPYDLEELTWDLQHKNNVEQSYCYCGGPGIWYQKMLQCCRCKQWFHEACMQCTEYPLMFADSFYIFVCSPCNFGDEYIKRLDVEWPDLVHIALFNLALDHRRKYFDLLSDIMPWLHDSWNMLQVKEYEGLSMEEKKDQVDDALRINKNRFTNGQEVRKKCSLWGLRVRVPPPRIHITLPLNGQVTDEVMKRLKIKGRRSKVFIPVECKSPVQQIKHSPFHGGAARKRLDEALTKKEDGTYSPMHNQGTPHVRKYKPKLPLLERLIPRQSSYVGYLHPFATELEQLEEKTTADTRDKIWSSYLSSITIDNASVLNENEDAASDGPPILEKVEPVVPNCNDTPPMPEIKDKKPEIKAQKRPGRKSVSLLPDDNPPSRRLSRRSQGIKLRGSENVSELQNTKDEFTVKKVKTNAGHYLYAYDKTGYGVTGFHVMGKRVNERLENDYLLHWDK